MQYVADVAGNGSSANFTRTHTFNSEGIFTITAVAFDTSGNYSDSTSSTVTVEAPSVNECADDYVAGERYRSGDVVENNSSNYQCTSNRFCKMRLKSRVLELIGFLHGYIREYVINAHLQW